MLSRFNEIGREMKIIEEAFAAKRHTETGEPGWFYRICVARPVEGRGERKLYCKRWVSCKEANGYWYEDKAREYLKTIREKLFDHIRERGEVGDMTDKWDLMTTAPPKRMIWTPEAAGHVSH